MTDGRKTNVTTAKSHRLCGLRMLFSWPDLRSISSNIRPGNESLCFGRTQKSHSSTFAVKRQFAVDSKHNLEHGLKKLCFYPQLRGSRPVLAWKFRNFVWSVLLVNERKSSPLEISAPLRGRMALSSVVRIGPGAFFFSLRL